MVRFPNCKINLGLNITSKRPDGYHNLETVFYPILLRDALEIIQSTEFHFDVTGFKVEGNIDDNLCFKAYQLLKQDFPHLPSLKVHLHKAIPMGAGLGGGSSNGAFMLSMINDEFRLGLSENSLINYALRLGSDCPFFIINKPCFATGRGEILEAVNLNLSSYKIVIVNPGIHVSTKDAFSKLSPQAPATSIKEIIQQPIETWKDALKNDFEATIFELYPPIKEIKDEMYAKGALYSSMTGTGSTVYGIFPKASEATFAFPQNFTAVVLP
jgi:4-diphosphocytidyl-2-C-methyl-D-erythritol kinase